MNAREITVVLYDRRFVRDDWRYDLDEAALATFFAGLQSEYGRFGITLRLEQDAGVVIEVRGYADLLNAIRLRSPHDGIGNLCLGHILGASANRDLLEDIRRGVSRVAFAPETIAPEEQNRRVCHNCGCGC